ncbi:C6 transcription factor, putative [Cordyceps militaris CM01]|uniref:C6 transcription factor, putative n=1 Tax=Cordyceps militaris (strain CM01) TaxID=983644 RepID=G3JT55_CORMM|nr:C6 transcription factor, putative [Cordyceps militaris CM01]EGX88202.1 C6 transcription factor, putative [Cordyceps militaris CM01]
MVTRGSSTAHHPAGDPTHISETSTSSLNNTGAGPRNKRPTPRQAGSEAAGNRRKLQKVSRACDYCKLKKLRCTGNVPCEVCAKKRLHCLYDAQYRRGRPPTPQAGETTVRHHATQTPPAGGVSSQSDIAVERTGPEPGGEFSNASVGEGPQSRASPELETAELEGQFFDLNSNFAFLHRAWKRFSCQKGGTIPDVLTGSERSQPLVSAGDRPLLVPSGETVRIPDRQGATQLFEFYFENCVVTYRCLHRQYCASFLQPVLHNAQQNLPLHHNIGHAKAALIINIFAIASLRKEKTSGSTSPYNVNQVPLSDSDHYFCEALRLTTAETGLPRLESVQARMLQVLFLLQTGRMNQAWYIFGGTVPIVSALGLHRTSGRGGSRNVAGVKTDYIVLQCRRRTFWVVYIIDKYLSVVFGRPRLLHDDDINQEYPDHVNDEDMNSHGPSASAPTFDCHIDSLIAHAKIARIIDNISREVYSLKPVPTLEKFNAAKKFRHQLHDWRRGLPAYLGTIQPRSLIPSFCRQAIALKLAYCHAVMHANRPFILGYNRQSASSSIDEIVSECISAAKMALETVDDIMSDGMLFHAFWWTPYATFCAVAVVYVWEIQQRGRGGDVGSDPLLMELAERCHKHLYQAAATYSLGLRYSIILEELRLQARQGSVELAQHQFADTVGIAVVQDNALDIGPGSGAVGLDVSQMPNDIDAVPLPPLNEWQLADWLDLDSSALVPISDLENFPVIWDV